MRNIRSMLLLVVCLAGAVLAQTNLGRIVGNVRDSSGAAVPGAAVKVTNEGTGWTRDFSSLESGDYEIANVLAGTYSIQAERSGFRRFARTGLVLDAGRTIRVDVQLELGDLTQEVRVTALSATVVETETPSISSRIDYELQIKSAVSTGNRPWELLVAVPTLQSGPGVFVYSIAGNRGAQNEFHIDGIASVGSDSPLGSTSMSTGATIELKVQGVNNSAEYSQSGIYQQISRPGTNDFHGDLRYYHSNSALNARSYFAAAKPSSKSHNFGVWAGGPLHVPGLYKGRDRTFWMLSYEGGRTPQSAAVNANVPTAAMRTGDFTGLSTIRDPSTGQPFPGNRIPADRLSPVSQRLQDRFYPLPNFGNTAVLAAQNHRILFRNAGKFDHADARFDQKLTRNNTLYFHLGYQQFPVRNLEGGLPAIGALARLREFWNPNISDTHIFSPTLINEFRAGGTRSFDPIRGPQRGLEVLQFAGIQGIQNVPDAAGMPQVNILGLQSLTQAAQSVQVDQQAQITDSVTWIRGQHSLKAGVDLRRPTPLRHVVPLGTYGTFTFSGALSGHAYSDFLLGLPQETGRNYPSPGEYRRQWQWAFFVQDSFKLSRRLTLELGLRYEYQTPTSHLMDAMYNFDPSTGGLVLISDRARQLLNPLFNPRIPISVADGACMPQGEVWRADRNNFAPRLGFAFRPTASNTFAVRGAYGVFYDTIGYGLAGSVLAGPFTPGVETFTNSIVGGRPLFQFPRPFPDAGAGPTASLPNIFAIIPHLRNPYVQQWNLTVEKEKRGIGLRASYLGTKGTQLLVRRNINKPLPSTVPFNQSRRPYPLYQSISLADQGGNQIYHAMQLEANRRAQSLLFGASYTWSNTISDAADGGGEVANEMENPYDRRSERARESYALTHQFKSYAIWRLPVGVGRRYLPNISGVADRVLGGWELTINGYLQTGPWFNPTFAGLDPSNTNTVGGRADRLRDGNLDSPTADRWFDVSAFAAPPANAGRFGNTGRNVLEGPPTKVLHLTLGKDFPLYEKVKLNLMLAARNVLNTPNFNIPPANISAPTTVARIAGIQGDLLAGSARNVQVRAVISW